MDSKAGEHWFLHFQDKEAYGRIVHLQPMRWVNDWPVIGMDKDGDGKGEPVMVHKKPLPGNTISTPPDSDEFNSHTIGLQWQWQANPEPYWAFIHAGNLRLFAAQLPDTLRNYWNAPNLIMQKFPAEEFIVNCKLNFKPRVVGEKAGLIVFGSDYATLCLEKKSDGIYISYFHCKDADKGTIEKELKSLRLDNGEIYLQVKISKTGNCKFSFSKDGKDFTSLEESFIAKPGRWVGAKIGLYCNRMVKTNDAGYVDVDYFRFEPIK